VRKRRLCLLLIAIAVLVGVLAVIFRREREPEYGGRKLSEWVLRLPVKPSELGPSEAEEAIRHIGTNAVPYLLKWISREPARWQVKLYQKVSDVLRNAPNAVFQDQNMLRAVGAAEAFSILGPKANVAKRELRRLANDPQGGLSKVHATIALVRQETRGHSIYIGIINVTAYSGADVFGLTYRTNGMPVLTFSPKASNGPSTVPARL